MNHMMFNNLFSSQRYGFVKGRSTVLQLLNVMDVWTNAIDKGDSMTLYILTLQRYLIKCHIID